MLKKILVFLLILLVVLAGFLAYSGFFDKVEIVETNVGPYVFAGKEYVGDYKTSGIHQDSIFKDLISRGIAIEEGFGIYRDDPDKVPVDKCRFMVGCVLPEKDTLRNVELDRAGYIIQNMNVTNSMLVEFPFRNKFSIIASVMKVYPALDKYILEHNYHETEVVEIYTNDKIYISMEIKKDD